MTAGGTTLYKFEKQSINGDKMRISRDRLHLYSWHGTCFNQDDFSQFSRSLCVLFCFGSSLSFICLLLSVLLVSWICLSRSFLIWCTALHPLTVQVCSGLTVLIAIWTTGECCPLSLYDGLLPLDRLWTTHPLESPLRSGPPAQRILPFANEVKWVLTRSLSSRQSCGFRTSGGTWDHLRHARSEVVSQGLTACCVPCRRA